MNSDCNGGEQRKTPVALVVMGPCACGKSEVASALSRHYECDYIDADSLHSASNIQKMSNGIPLTDEDRFPWLKIVRERLVTVVRARHKVLSTTSDAGDAGNNADNVTVVVACSALKKSYREILRGAFDNSEDGSCGIRTIFIFLNCSTHVLENRIAQREGHFMKSNMLQSQLNTLEKPGDDELAISVNGDETLSTIISYVVGRLRIGLPRTV